MLTTLDKQGAHNAPTSQALLSSAFNQLLDTSSPMANQFCARILPNRDRPAAQYAHTKMELNNVSECSITLTLSTITSFISARIPKDQDNLAAVHAPSATESSLV
jgi:hypothetical protein